MGNCKELSINYSSQGSLDSDNSLTGGKIKAPAQKLEFSDFEKIYKSINQNISEYGSNYGLQENSLGALLSPLIATSKLPPHFSQYELQHRPRVINRRRIEPDYEIEKIENYIKLELIGQGTYGRVYKSMDVKRNKFVALKNIRLEPEVEGFPITSLREIKILTQLKHENIVKLLDIVHDEKRLASTYIVFEYMNHDLNGLLQNADMAFNEDNIYQITRQLLNGLLYCHSENVVHRDLKTSNILVNNRGQVKIADFGLARQWEPSRPFTNKVISLWYRPIELLLGEEFYDFSADVWSLGCIVVELFQRYPLFPYNTELKMIQEIYNVCGSPEANNWKNARNLPNFMKHKRRERVLKKFLVAIPKLALDLIDKMLALDPTRRITISSAVQSEWIQTMQKKKLEPMTLPSIDSFEMKMRKGLV